MLFKLAGSAEKSRRRPDGPGQLPRLIQGVKFIDGIAAIRQDAPPL
jgi:hypothetical protein